MKRASKNLKCVGKFGWVDPWCGMIGFTYYGIFTFVKSVPRAIPWPRLCSQNTKLREGFGSHIYELPSIKPVKLPRALTRSPCFNVYITNDSQPPCFWLLNIVKMFRHLLRARESKHTLHITCNKCVLPDCNKFLVEHISSIVFWYTRTHIHTWSSHFCVEKFSHFPQVILNRRLRTSQVTKLFDLKSRSSYIFWEWQGVYPLVVILLAGRTWQSYNVFLARKSYSVFNVFIQLIKTTR